MKRSLFIVALLALAIAAGVLIGRTWQPAPHPLSETTRGEREILYWKAPMDPNYRRDKPGKSPMGMDLVPVYADEPGDDEPGLVSIDPVMVNNLGVRTERAQQGVLSRRIETVGYVGYDEDTYYQVSTRVDGWVERLAVKSSGEPVTAGQVLFELYSPDLVNAQEEYLAASRSGNTTLRNASRERLVALGITASQIRRLDNERKVRPRIPVYARQDGVVSHLGIREGSHVTPATQIMAIAGLDRVWVLAEVFERQAAWVQPDLPVQIRFDSLPGRTWDGIVDHVYPQLDDATRTLKVRVRLDNENQVLRPNMLARVVIAGADSEPLVHIARQALIRGGATDRVVLALGDGRFRSVTVEPGIESGDRIAIISGLSAGDRVVTSGQFLLDSESNIDVALERMAPKPARVVVGAVVEGWRVAQRVISLRHDPVEEWSWPAMSMRFAVDDPALLRDLSLGQRVDVQIEKTADDRYVITRIEAGAAQ